MEEGSPIFLSVDQNYLVVRLGGHSDFGGINLSFTRSAIPQISKCVFMGFESENLRFQFVQVGASEMA
ncbi:MAG: hypothetical protein DMG05_11475 [Acidobacteria bacterium]|nr:MAG: hypothetical protein DMG05_11475 [Acidobacteriota bacterium]